MGAIRRQVLYSGRVQGVGFRFTTFDVARRFEVTGYVRNLPDGRVELVAEGEAGELDRFGSAVSDAMGGLIRETEVTDAQAQGEFDGFNISY